MEAKTFLDIPERATPATPASGKTRLFSGTDGRFRGVDDSGGVYRMDNCVVRDFSATGTLTVRTGVMRVPILFDCVIEAVAAMVNTAPTGAAILLDVNLSGTTIFTTQANRPTIAIGANAATVGAWAVTTAAPGQYLTVDIDQIGSTVAGANLVLALALRRS